MGKIKYLYYDIGQIESERNYKDNQLNGKSTYWYKNGQKLSEGNYKDDKPNGKWTFWKKNGQKDEERNYKDNDLVDKTIFKYSYFTGHLKSEKKYKDGKCISGDC
jgi:antitoxin component YwqK of YwqJK toxin-antitoxin module